MGSIYIYFKKLPRELNPRKEASDRQVSVLDDCITFSRIRDKRIIKRHGLRSHSIYLRWYREVGREGKVMDETQMS